jgi:hypothetical protein
MAATGDTEMAHAHSQENLHNPDTSHETSDVNIRAIIWFVVVLTATAVLIDVAMYGMFKALDSYERSTDAAVSPLALPAGTAPPEPRLQTTPWTDLTVLRGEESDYLHGYGWIDQKAGVARIPIEKAKALLLQRGIPSRPGAEDPTEGTHAAAFGQSNSGRTIPSGGGL